MLTCECGSTQFECEKCAANNDTSSDIEALQKCRDTVHRLNQRCQLAESAVAEKIKGGPSFGRMLAIAAAELRKLEHLREEAEKVRDDIIHHHRILAEMEEDGMLRDPWHSSLESILENAKRLDQFLWAMRDVGDRDGEHDEEKA